MLLGCAPAGAERFEDGRYAMGTVFEVTVEAQRGAREAAEACFDLAARLEGLLSRWDEGSEISRLNAAAGGEPLAVHPDTGRILRDAIHLSQLTRGSFDVTVGPLVELWTEAGHLGRRPSQAALAEALARVGADGIEVGPLGARLARPGMSVDLGGVAKGWALDRMEELLRARGVERAFLSFGQSSLLALGAPGAEGGWRVLVRATGERWAGVATLRDRRLSISGSFGRFETIGGERYGHVIDPRDGEPVRHAALAVVLAPTAALAEAWSKALLILAPTEAKPLLEAQAGVEGLLVDEAGGRHATAGFEEAVSFQWLPQTSAPATD